MAIMQSLNPNNAKTYDYMRRSNEVADRVLNKSHQLLAKTWDKKHMRSLGIGARETKSASGNKVNRVCSPPRKRALSPAAKATSPDRYGGVAIDQPVALLNPYLYTYVHLYFVDFYACACNLFYLFLCSSQTMRNLLSQQKPASIDRSGASLLPLDQEGCPILMEQPAAAFSISSNVQSPSRQHKHSKHSTILHSPNKQKSGQTLYNEHFSGLEVKPHSNT